MSDAPDGPIELDNRLASLALSIATNGEFDHDNGSYQSSCISALLEGRASTRRMRAALEVFEELKAVATRHLP